MLTKKHQKPVKVVIPVSRIRNYIREKILKFFDNSKTSTKN